MGKKTKSTANHLKTALRHKDNNAAASVTTTTNNNTTPQGSDEERGSSKPLPQPALPGTGFKVLGEEGYDDGGVADLSLLIDLEDCVQRRKRGEEDYAAAAKADLLPRATHGPLASLSRREQKVRLAQLLFAEDDETHGGDGGAGASASAASSSSSSSGPSEVYMDQVDGGEDAKTMRLRAARVAQARAALRLSLLLREPACASLSLAELCKRKLTHAGKAGAAEALRCADKALEIAGAGFWDGEDVAAEAEDEPKVPPAATAAVKEGSRRKKSNAARKKSSTPGLANPQALKLLPLRVSHLCQRSALLQRGNALAALGREDEARESYMNVFPLLEKEPRCARVDWERHSLLVNIGNTYSRTGFLEEALEQYQVAERLGRDHLEQEGGSLKDGSGMICSTKRARAVALKRAGRLPEAKALMKEVLQQQILDREEAEKEKAAAAAAAKENEEKEKKQENGGDDAGESNT